MEEGRKRKALADCTNTIHNTTTRTKPTNTASVFKNPSLSSVFNRLLGNDLRSSKPVRTSNVAVADSSNENVVVPSASVNSSSSVAVSSTPVQNLVVSGTGEREVVEPCSVHNQRRASERRKSKVKEIAGSTPVKGSAVLGTSEREVVEPCSVYTQRRTSGRRKSKDKEIAGSTPVKDSAVLRTGERDFGEPVSVYSRRRTRTSERQKSKGKEVAGYTPISFQYIRDDDKEVGKVTGSRKSGSVHREKKKKDEPVHELPRDFIEKQRAYFAEIDAFELSEEEVESVDQLD